GRARDGGRPGRRARGGRRRPLPLPPDHLAGTGGAGARGVVSGTRAGDGLRVRRERAATRRLRARGRLLRARAERRGEARLQRRRIAACSPGRRDGRGRGLDRRRRGRGGRRLRRLAGVSPLSGREPGSPRTRARRREPGSFVSELVGAPATRVVSMTVNGESYEREVEARLLLSDFIRHDLGLTGTHV